MFQSCNKSLNSSFFPYVLLNTEWWIRWWVLWVSSGHGSLYTLVWMSLWSEKSSFCLVSTTSSPPCPLLVCLCGLPATVWCIVILPFPPFIFSKTTLPRGSPFSLVSANGSHLYHVSFCCFCILSLSFYKGMTFLTTVDKFEMVSLGLSRWPRVIQWHRGSRHHNTSDHPQRCE